MNFLERLEKYHLIFLDTAPIIYFVEKNPIYAAFVQPVFEHLDEGKITGVVSPITLAECLVLPYKIGRLDLIQIFTELLVYSQQVIFCEIDQTIADKAANLRARYNLTLTDAIQIATAIQAGCDAFLTNDADLKKISDLPILFLSE
jgi:predicted nucleic acid-binding protein